MTRWPREGDLPSGHLVLRNARSLDNEEFRGASNPGRSSTRRLHSRGPSFTMRWVREAAGKHGGDMRTIIAATLLLAVAAQADDSNYRNTLIGERAFGLAGTFTALADDSSGIFYNPAGIVDANKDSFSLSASVYTLQNMTLKKAFAPLDSNLQEDIESSTFSSVPSTVGSLS